MSVLFGLVFYLLGIALFVAVLAVGYHVWLAATYPEPLLGCDVHTVRTGDDWSLQLYRRRPEGGGGEPVFLCHNVMGNHLTFQYPAGLSLVDTLVGAGYDCWLADLRGCRSATPPAGRRKSDVTLDDMLVHDIPSVLACIREQTGSDRVHWVGHSLGGMLAYAYDLDTGGAGLASMTTLCALPGFDGIAYKPAPTLLGLATRLPWLLAGIVRGLAPLYKRLRIQTPVMPVNWENVSPELDTGALFNGLEGPAPLIVKELDFWAAHGIWRMRNDHLDVAARIAELHTPLLAVFGEADTLTPRPQMERFIESLQNPDTKAVWLGKAEGFSADYNHGDVIMSPHGPREVYPLIVDWLASHPARTEAKPAGRPKPRAKARPVRSSAPAESAPKKPRARKPAAAKASTPKKKAATRKPKSTSGGKKRKPVSEDRASE